MDLFSIELIFLTAIGLGLAHSLDADHVMAVTGLFSNKPGIKTSLNFCFRWAIGHGLVLGIVASLVFLFKASIPFELSEVAESLVGVVLIFIGISVFWQIIRKPLGISLHRHGSNPAHVHWHKSGQSENHHHTATLIGMLHGLAGSAPLLVLIPIADLGAAQAFGYVLVFSLGVVLSMLAFGVLLGKGYQLIGRISQRMMLITRGLVATLSIGFGMRLLYGLL